MKKADNSDNDPEIREEYDFSKGVRGKYTSRFAENTIMVVLDPDVADVFPDSKSVNDALRTIANIVRKRSQKAST